jgi:hypothetical protein
MFNFPNEYSDGELIEIAAFGDSMLYKSLVWSPTFCTSQTTSSGWYTRDYSIIIVSLRAEGPRALAHVH